MARAVQDARAASASTSPQRISRVASEPLPGQALFKAQRPHNITPREDALLAQLGPFASQHHTSDYNRAKFGPNGSPLVYVPYSVQMPDHYNEMRAHQTRCAAQKAWWPHKGESSHTIARVPQLNENGVPITPSECARTMDLREQLSAAISTSMILPRVGDDRHVLAFSPQPHWQTSETHPIVISTVIPTELLPIISAHRRLLTERYPVVFHIPHSHLLDCLILARVESDFSKPSRVSSSPFVAPIDLPRFPPELTPSQSIAKSFRLSSLFWVHPTVRRALLGNEDASRPTSKKRSRPASFVAPDRPSMNATASSMDEAVSHRPGAARNRSSPSVIDGHVKMGEIRSQQCPTPRAGSANILHTATGINVSVPAVPSIPAEANARLFGNLYLSSCPGKKVRLGGPVRGRNTVCRDLMSDLFRIKGVGVACIVCCLDDVELQTLGVSWSDYARTADELGIDVLRIPIPEGLAPIDAAALDSHLTKLIENYTLRGSAILVHCRGGVGRAGIIACCWTLKLGLCGWLQSHPGTGAVNSAPTAGQDAEITPETLHLIEKLISVVRRRRSLKAVETFEQVKFLVDYVKFLKERVSAETPLSMDFFAD